MFDSDSILSFIKSDNSKEFFAVEPLSADIFIVNEHNFYVGGQMLGSSDLTNCRAVFEDLFEKRLITIRGEPADALFFTIHPLAYIHIWEAKDGSTEWGSDYGAR